MSEDGAVSPHGVGFARWVIAGLLMMGLAAAIPTSVADPAATPADAAPVADGNGLMAPPGSFHVVRGLRLHMHCVGEGRPAVVIDTGIGAFSLEWSPVLERLKDVTRVCVWDRPGYGWSDPGPAPRVTPQVAGELLDLLQEAGMEGPWVLVGHSFGGFTARYLAASSPDRVAALLLVESSTPATEVVAIRGARRASPLTRNLPIGTGQPRTREEVAQFLNTRRKAIMTQMDELKHFHISSEAVLKAGPLPPVPLIVLERGRRAWPEGAEGDAAEQDWHEAQAALGRLTPDGELRRLDAVGHSPHVERPDLVADTIQELVERVRRGKPTNPGSTRTAGADPSQTTY